MKPLDILDALSDLPEEYTAFAVQNDTSEISSETAQSAQEEIVMNTQTDMKKKQHTFRIGKAGIAAAVAVCIGLNAALIYGIRQMKTVEVTSPNPAFSAGPGGAEPDETVPHMELIDATPTGAQIVLLNPTDEELSVSGRFAVYQGSERAAECEEGTPGAVRVRANDKQYYIVNFPQLPAGEYTLYNLSENGKEPGTFGCVDFEISAEYDSMVWIPEIHNMPYEEAKALLEEKGVQVSKAAFAFLPDMDISDFEAFFEVGDVVTMSVPPYKTEVQMLGTQPYCHRDGKGYWVQPGETVTLEVYNGADGDPSAVPAVAGMDYEEAQKSIWAEGFTIEKHLAYDPIVPAGKVISTEPKQGAACAVGAEIRVTVSLGAKKDTVKIPGLENMPLKYAKLELEERGLEVEVCHIRSGSVRLGDTVNTEPQAGMEIALGGTVRLNISAGNHSAASFVPNLNGMQWEEAKQTAAEAGFLLAKQEVDSNGEAPGTVVYHCPEPDAEEPEGSVILCNVVTDPKAPGSGLSFTVPETVKCTYYIYVRGQDQEILGYSTVFQDVGFIGFTFDRVEEGTVVEAVLVNYDTGKEAVIGSYRIHQAPEAFSEQWHSFDRFDVITEDVEAAFRQITG